MEKKEKKTIQNNFNN